MTGTGREPQRTDLGRRRRWGWPALDPGLSPFGAHLEACRQLRGYTQAYVAKAVGMRTAEYRKLLKHDSPPVTFDQLVSLCATVRADPVEMAMWAWAMTREEATELGLKATTAPVTVSQPCTPPNASTG